MDSASGSASGSGADGYDTTASATAATVVAAAAEDTTAAAAAAAAIHYGLSIRADGFYDKRARRLFLLDGSPDPLTPGAYRVAVSPDLCDLAAPESDPSSPRYEPPHLRHQPGDDWEIGGKPYDPDDPGPFGSYGWRPDPRTGRHRRGELPDPLPPNDTARFDPRRTGTTESDRPTPSPAPPTSLLTPEDDAPQPQAASSGSVPPWRPRSRTASPPAEPSEPEDGSGNSPRPVTPDRPSPKPRDRSRFWSQSDRSQPEHTMNHQRRNHFDHEPANRSQSTATVVGTDQGTAATTDTTGAGLGPGATGPGSGPVPVPASNSVPSPYRFDKLREDAWGRFLDKSTELAAAHHRNRGTALERECGWQIALWIRFFRWLLAVIKGSSAKTEPPQPNPGSHNPNSRNPEPPALPNQAGRSDQTGPADRVGRAERARRTALATRSTRLASAVRGAQRARIEADSASSSAENGPEAERPGPPSRSSSRSDTARPRFSPSSPSRSESIGAHLFGGAAWA
ncbi:hypothetical protein [Glycomyces rhizosphaerae]|uniref:Uncharacterized protein n=1 Tax=Glycomyces rhizosphaerae TaxID=2054422 RepID=A0ABV7Q124_9ACTN